MILLSNTEGGRLVLNKRDDKVAMAYIKTTACKLKIFNTPSEKLQTQSITSNITQAYEV